MNRLRNRIVVGEIVGEAIDVVFHQVFDEGDGRCRIAEVIEVEKPGATIHPNGSVEEFRFRRLVAWTGPGRAWLLRRAGVRPGFR